jgi:hypothetical protein
MTVGIFVLLHLHSGNPGCMYCNAEVCLEIRRMAGAWFYQMIPRTAFIYLSPSPPPLPYPQEIHTLIKLCLDYSPPPLPPHTVGEPPGASM